MGEGFQHHPFTFKEQFPSQGLPTLLKRILIPDVEMEIMTLKYKILNRPG
jgi:hypothetical protein